MLTKGEAQGVASGRLAFAASLAGLLGDGERRELCDDVVQLPARGRVESAEPRGVVVEELLGTTKAVEHCVLFIPHGIPLYRDCECRKWERRVGIQHVDPSTCIVGTRWPNVRKKV